MLMFSNKNQVIFINFTDIVCIARKQLINKCNNFCRCLHDRDLCHNKYNIDIMSGVRACFMGHEGSFTH